MSTFAASPARGEELLNKFRSILFDCANKNVAESILKLTERDLTKALLEKMEEIAVEVETYGWSSDKTPLNGLDAHLRVASHLSRVFPVLNVPESDGSSPRIPMAELALLDIVIRNPQIVGAESAETVNRFRKVTTAESHISHRLSR